MMKPFPATILTLTLFLALSSFGINACSARALTFTQQTLTWQQVDRLPSFVVFSDRDIYSSLDKAARIVFAVQVGGTNTAPLAAMHVAWQIRGSDGESLASADSTLEKGMAYVDFSTASLVLGDYTIAAVFLDGVNELRKMQTSFSVVSEVAPPASGTIPILFPTGVPIGEGTYPITCGIPFPKGALFSPDDIQLQDASGKPVPCQTIVRSRWGSAEASSIRWLGLDFQAPRRPVWDSNTTQGQYRLIYGPDVKRTAPSHPLRIDDIGVTFEVDTGNAQFSIKKAGFNLFDKVVVDGKPVVADAGNAGLYLIDQNGDIYRSANDRESRASIEEAGPLRSVIRVAGWYVKDGADGETQQYALPTDKLCKFITRLEFYAGKSCVRVLSTWIITYDIFSIQLRDLGMTIPMPGIRTAEFGVENEAPFVSDVGESGVYLLQHLHNAFDIVANGSVLKSGNHCAGWFSAGSRRGSITASLRAAWQRYPKEFEVLPDMLKIHSWPAHGKDHPEIDELTHQNLTRILYAHQGKEMNLAMPWKYYLAAAKIRDSGRTGVYSAAGQVLAGVHSGALGCALTSDILIEFSSAKAEKNALQVAECFQKRPHALADPAWNCASLAAGYLHPYDPERFPVMEKTIQDSLEGYNKVNDVTQEYGMWIYRRWHHSNYLGDEKWNLYRFNNTTHHHEALMPWLFYFRSGNPFYLQMGEAHLRNMSDVGIIHYEDPKYPQKEFHFHQKALLGSTKHTNGFVPWGADHAVAGHLTCYDALIWAYYLTGDLRYKEIVVDEWQKTITEKRGDPEYNKADRSITTDGSIIAGKVTGARDVDCFVGELLELYRLTYNPKVLAVLGPRLKVMENNPITDWGMPLHNVILYYGSAKLRGDLTEFAREFSAAGVTPTNNPHLFWYYGYREHEPLTLASIIDGGDKDLANAAFYAAAPWQAIEWSQQIRSLAPDGPNFFSVPDVILKYPHLMYACVQAGCDTAEEIIMKQPMPVGDMKAKGWTRCLVKEEADADISLDIFGSASRDAKMVIYDPDHERVLSTRIPAQSSARQAIIIPKDDKIGVYTIFILGADNATMFRVPISKLPEVYCVSYWCQMSPGRFFVNYPTGEDRELTITPHKAPGIITNVKADQVLAETKTGDGLSVTIPAEGAWFSSKAHYVSLGRQGVMAVSPERWFAPDKEEREWLPKAIE